MPVGDLRSPSAFPVPVLRARGLRKQYGSGRGARVVLDGVDLDLARGELVAIVGRRARASRRCCTSLGGLDRADAGSVEVVGRPVTGASERELSALRRDEIGFVFQFFHLVPELDGEANVLLPTRLPGAAREARARGRALIERLGLATCAARAAPAVGRRAAAVRAGAGAGRRPGAGAGRRADRQPRRRSGAVVLDLLRAIADDGRGVLMVTHQAEATGDAPTACCGSRTGRLATPRVTAAPRATSPRQTVRRFSPTPAGCAPGAAHALAAAGCSPPRSCSEWWLTAAYALATGFDRAADRADLPSVIARFADEDRDEVDERVSRLPNLAARAYRTEITGVGLAARGRPSTRAWSTSSAAVAVATRSSRAGMSAHAATRP